jgi:hypothetical protein
MNPVHRLTPYLYNYRDTNTGNGLPSQQKQKMKKKIAEFYVTSLFVKFTTQG